MATREQIIAYSMYVIGTVESNCNWAAVYRADPITIGIMQNYGQRAARCITRCRESDPTGYATFEAAAPGLCAAVDAQHDWTWWTNYYISDAEAAAWETWAARDENHAGQSALWTDDANDYINGLLANGCSLDHPQVLIYAMCMNHQSPKQCGRVLASCGGSATLDNMHATCLNDSVLGKYKNRYNTAYQLLANWDGEAAPPDFGQTLDTPGGGQAPSINQGTAAVTRLVVTGGLIIAFGSGIYQNGITFYKSAPDTWLPCEGLEGVTNPGGNTGGGTSTGNQASQEIVDWLLAHQNAFAYSQGSGRMSPETSGYTDCSALMWYVYHNITGKEIGTWTGDQVGKGTLVKSGSGDLPQSEMQLADLVFFNWGNYNPTFDHVECYIGDNRLVGHGGPGNGPYIKPDANAYSKRAHDWMIRRYL